MACFHPMKAIQFKNIRTINGKGSVKILSLDEIENGRWKDCVDYEAIKLPCGQCSGCRMDYARQWANRLMLELESFRDDPDHTGDAYFVTLTINDDHINDYRTSSCHGRGDEKQLDVLRPYADPDTGVHLGWSHSLNKVDLQLFLKRLRKYHPNDKIRFFACGEYGSTTFRPHYHLIIFGLTLDNNDLSFYKKSGLGYDYMNSEYISKCWPFGYNVVAPVTWESCCYVARYMMKKVLGPEGRKLYDKFNLTPPFTQMSRRPGIASKYYETHQISEDTSSIVIGTADGSRVFPPPRYLEKLFELDNPKGAEHRRKIRRLSAINSQNLVLSRTHKTAEQYLKDKEELFLKNVHVLNEYRNIV